MKKILLSAMIALISFSSVDAQNPQREGKRGEVSPEKIVKRMDRALDLTEQQEKDLTALYTDFYKDLKNRKEEGKKVNREERKAQRMEFTKKMNEILTPEQQQKWADIKKAQAEKRKARAEKNKKD